jgi:S-adenosylmethionine:tRNA ribosyltransferase-isomerase
VGGNDLVTLDVSAFDFDLPPELVAQHPAARGASRLLVLDRQRRTWEEGTVRDLPAHLRPGDLVVANDTKVFPARLLGRRDPTGGAVECLLIECADDNQWQALMHPGQKLKPGARIVFEDAGRAPGVRLVGEVLQQHFFGRRTLRLEAAGTYSVDEAIDALGHVPLPPYIHRPDTPADSDRYQTIYAAHRGSIAAPTAGLHFDAALIADLRARGIGWTTVTLHVGYGTFKPVRVADVEAHTVDPERWEISADAAARLNAALDEGRRIVAVGTTTTRALETVAAGNGRVRSGRGESGLFIYPGHQFRAVGALLTNFHLPESSLLMLVSAFGGRERVLAAYAEAVREGYRFYSYGDAMLVL